MSLFSSSNTAEFEELFRAHYKFLCNVANKILRNPAASEDVVQDVFVKLWAKRHELPQLNSGKNFLFRVTINATLDHLEKNKRIVRLEDDAANIAFSNATEESLELKELEMRIDQSLAELPPKCRTVFILSRYEGLKYREIADQMDISVKTVENHMGKALSHMRERLLPHLGKDHISLGTIIMVFAAFDFLSMAGYDWLPVIDFVSCSS